MTLVHAYWPEAVAAAWCLFVSLGGMNHILGHGTMIVGKRTLSGGLFSISMLIGGAVIAATIFAVADGVNPFWTSVGLFVAFAIVFKLELAAVKWRLFYGLVVLSLTWCLQHVASDWHYPAQQAVAALAHHL
jgi:hypothetical protein